MLTKLCLLGIGGALLRRAAARESINPREREQSRSGKSMGAIASAGRQFLLRLKMDAHERPLDMFNRCTSAEEEPRCFSRFQFYFSLRNVFRFLKCCLRVSAMPGPRRARARRKANMLQADVNKLTMSNKNLKLILACDENSK